MTTETKFTVGEYKTRDEVVEYVSHLRGVPVEIIRARKIRDYQA